MAGQAATPDSDPGIVIVGAGHAGGRAAEAIRAQGYTGKLTLVGAEAYRPYERPPLSKEILLDSALPEPFLRSADFYDEKGILLRLGVAVERLDLARKELALSDGSALSYSRLLIATGGRPRRISHLESGEIPAIYLRDLDDALRLRAALQAGRRIVIIGAGVIGLEIAAAARKRGCEVSVVELADRVMSRVASPMLSDWIAARHREAGVRILPGASAEGVSSAGVRLSDGQVLPADLIVIGVGIRPNDEFAAASGLAVDDGILIDEWGQTSAPDVYATGDVAARHVPQFGRRMRIETWANAQNHGIAVASTICGQRTTDPDPPWYWTDQFDFNVQVAGAPSGEQDVVRGDPSSGAFTLFHLRKGLLVGATTVNNRREMAIARRLVRDMASVDSKDLANPGFDLRKAAQNDQRRRQDAEHHQRAANHSG